MNTLLNSEEFKNLESEFPFLRRAREQLQGLSTLGYVVVDIETTGLSPAENEITEIAALRLEKGEIKDVFGVLVRVDRALPPEIIKLTGITDEMLVESGEEKKAALGKFKKFAGHLPLIAHNVEFDIPFLNCHLKKELGETLDNPLICTLKLSRKLLPGLSSHKLAQAAAYFKIPTPLTHRAPGDVEITYQLWLKFAEMLTKQGVTTLDALQKFAPPL